jgi:prolyl-tRNA synthetase
VLAVPVIQGEKSESEKFAGALKTLCIESMMQDGKALQMGTSHNLGQNFARVFDVQFQDRDGTLKHVWQTSWGVSTRLIGALIMAHSDDTGLVLPPRVAPVQVVIVPIWRKEKDKANVLKAIATLEQRLEGRCDLVVDDREEHKPGFKFFEWERKGVPLRIEIGPRDLEAGTWMFVRRDTGEKTPVDDAGVVEAVERTLDQIQASLLQRAAAFRDERTFRVDTWDAFASKNEELDGGFFHAHWCGSADCEAAIQEETKATLRCIPFEREAEKGACIKCGKESPGRVIFAKGY